jgi:hypothetical protein
MLYYPNINCIRWCILIHNHIFFYISYRLLLEKEEIFIFSFILNYSRDSQLPPTECRGQVINTPASYSGGPGFKSWPWC